MARELEILEKFKANAPLTEGDKEQIYAAKLFLAPGSGDSTTLLHQITLLQNGDQILSQLDKSHLLTALLTGDGSPNSSTPLYSLLDNVTMDSSMSPDHHINDVSKNMICYFYDVPGVKEFFEDAKDMIENEYGQGSQYVVNIIHECEKESGSDQAGPAGGFTPGESEQLPSNTSELSGEIFTYGDFHSTSSS